MEGGIRAFVAFLIAMAGRGPFASAQVATQPAPATADAFNAAVTSKSLRIFLITVGQGEQVYELFGHNALWVHDPARSIDTVYNWGVFDFRTPGFIGRFLLGDMHYQMVGDPLDLIVAFYQSLNRQVWAQELNLTEAEKRSLIEFMRWNARPENSTYRYDYYLDNCSTRVRDAIDRVAGGAVRAHLQSIKTDETYRSHSLRLMRREKLMVSGVDVALGRRTDIKLTADQASFLPVQLMQYLRGVKLDGGSRSLIGQEFVVYNAARAPEPSSPPKLWMAFLPIGLLMAGIVVFLATRARSGMFAATVATLAGLFGIIGAIITFLVTVTDHVAAHDNENLFLLNPLWLAIAVLAPLLIRRGRARNAARWISIGAAAVAILAVVIHLIGLSRQPNWDVIALVLPVELAIAWALLDVSRSRAG